MDHPKSGWRGGLALFSLLFSVCVVLFFMAAALGTKFGLWDWQTGLGTLTRGIGVPMAMGAAGLAILSMIIALVKFPRKRPFILSLGALLVAGLVLGRGMMIQARALQLPPIHDVQTDWNNPIMPSAALTKARSDDKAANPIEAAPVVEDAAEGGWPGTAGQLVSELQEEAEYNPANHAKPKLAPYPTLETLSLPYPSENVFDAALEAVKSNGWAIVSSDKNTGMIEATATTGWYGFRDDVLIRIAPDGEGARVDMRSVSRVGLSDLGANSKRVSNFLADLKYSARALAAE